MDGAFYSDPRRVSEGIDSRDRNTSGTGFVLSHHDQDPAAAILLQEVSFINPMVLQGSAAVPCTIIWTLDRRTCRSSVLPRHERRTTLSTILGSFCSILSYPGARRTITERSNNGRNKSIDAANHDTAKVKNHARGLIVEANSIAYSGHWASNAADPSPLRLRLIT
ncbi:uncharacterized protein BDW70DRAFT_40790 [Aspergillus foveolatus]|uniref:uncharacterized protein n=1 Tax=Aspergillus foveolatus TaxID=210207 RepID=UPI003CCDA0FE